MCIKKKWPQHRSLFLLHVKTFISKHYKHDSNNMKVDVIVVCSTLEASKKLIAMYLKAQRSSIRQ